MGEHLSLEPRKMLRSLMTVSGFTLVSRLLGFARDILVARFLGAGIVAEAFFAAFRFPNLFRRIFGEGAFNAAFVPMFGKKVDKDKGAALEFASRAFTVLLMMLGIFSIVAIPLMPFLMGLMVPGFKARDLDPSLWKKKTEIVLSKGHDLDLATKQAKSMYVDLLGQGEVRLTEVVFEDEQKSLGSLFGKPGKLIESYSLQAPQVFTLESSGKGGTFYQPDFAAIKDKDERENFEKAYEKARKDNYVVEGFRWDDGVLVSLPNAEVYRIGRPTGKVGSSLDRFKAKLSGDGKVEVFRNHPETFPMTVRLTRIMFVYLLCMALAAHLSGVLNTFRLFGVPAAVPILLNLALLTALTLIGVFGLVPGDTLAWAVVVAGFLQLGALWITCRKEKAPVSLVKTKFDEDIKRLFVLMGPGVAAASVQQINLLIGSLIASFQPGAVSYIYYSDRVNQLPLGMIGIALGVVLLPEVTRQLSAGLEKQAGKTITRGIELGLLLTIPAMVAMIVVSEELIIGLFQRGEFTALDATQTGRALAAFGFGLPGYVLVKVLQPGYFAKGDTKRPMQMAVIMVCVNIVMSLILFPFIGHVGLAVATSIAAWVNVILLWRGLKGFVVLPESVVYRIGRIVLASSLMGVALYFAAKGLGPWFEGGAFQRITALILLVGTGASAYGAFAFFLRATSVEDLKMGFRK